jgi:hypothetical protein
MKYEDVFPAILATLDVADVTGVLPGQTISVVPIHSDLPSTFPAVGLFFAEKDSKPRPAYEVFPFRDCKGELSTFIQTQTSERDVRLIKSIIDQKLFKVGVSGTWNWRIIGEFEKITGDEKLINIKYYKQIIYQFEYTVLD